MTENELIIGKIIVADVKKAYETKEKEDISMALKSVKRIYNKDGSFNINIIKYLKKNEMTLIWNKVESNNHTENKLGVRYKDRAFEVSDQY